MCAHYRRESLQGLKAGLTGAATSTKIFVSKGSTNRQLSIHFRTFFRQTLKHHRLTSMTLLKSRKAFPTLDTKSKTITVPLSIASCCIVGHVSHVSPQPFAEGEGTRSSVLAGAAPMKNSGVLAIGLAAPRKTQDGNASTKVRMRLPLEPEAVVVSTCEARSVHRGT